MLLHLLHFESYATAIAQMTYTEAEAACEDHGVLVYRPQSGGVPTLLALQAALRAHLEKEGRSR